MNLAPVTTPASHAAWTRRTRQRGGFAMGLIVGLLVGLALALGVALYVTKAPNPFVNKVPQRSAVQDAAEAERNRNWDPNAALAGKTPARPASGAALPAPTAPAPTAPATAPPPAAAPPAAVAAVPPPAVVPPGRSPRASAPAGSDTTTSLSERPPAPATRASQPSVTLSTGGGADPFSYFVQAGAYARTEDAEQQRAKLAMLGIESRLTEREQAGRTVYRVRVGPFDRKEEADSAKERLNDAGIDSALVRVQK
jgi:cell division protein FtsN